MSSDLHLATVEQNAGGDLASALCASTTTVHHVLMIQGYSWMSKSLDDGMPLRTKSFPVGGSTAWHIAFYPNGSHPETFADFASVFIFLDAAYLAVNAEIGFDVLDHTTGEPVPRYTRNDDGEVRKFACVGAFCGYEDFIRREELEKVVLKDDCFTVRCSITVIEFLGDTPSPPPRPVVVVPPPEWPQHFRELLRSEQGADVRFHVGGETFAAHRCVLAARSPVFKAELYGVMKESIQIDGMRAEVFRNLLHFAYTDELPPPETEEDGAAMARHLLKAADRYGMERLKLVCEDRLCSRVDTSTVATTLLLAEQLRCHGLKEACYEFLLRSSTTLDAVMATDGFDHLGKTCPGLLKDITCKLGAHLHARRRNRQLPAEVDEFILRTTEGEKLPEPTHRVFPLGASKRMRL